MDIECRFHCVVLIQFTLFTLIWLNTEILAKQSFATRNIQHLELTCSPSSRLMKVGVQCICYCRRLTSNCYSCDSVIVCLLRICRHHVHSVCYCRRKKCASGTQCRLSCIECGLTGHAAACWVVFGVTTCLKQLKMLEFDSCRGSDQKSCRKNRVRENFLLLTSHLGLQCCVAHFEHFLSKSCWIFSSHIFNDVVSLTECMHDTSSNSTDRSPVEYGEFYNTWRVVTPHLLQKAMRSVVVQRHVYRIWCMSRRQPERVVSFVKQATFR